MVFKLFIVERYRKVGLGQNCPNDEMIISEGECEKALKSLDLSVENLGVNKSDKPAGCYWKSDGGGFFNNIVDPTSTDPNSFGNRGGVCTEMGKNC